MALSQMLGKLRLQQEPVCFGIVRGILKIVYFADTLSTHYPSAWHPLDLCVALYAGRCHFRTRATTGVKLFGKPSRGT